MNCQINEEGNYLLWHEGFNGDRFFNFVIAKSGLLAIRDLPRDTIERLQIGKTLAAVNQKIADAADNDLVYGTARTLIRRLRNSFRRFKTAGAA